MDANATRVLPGSREYPLEPSEAKLFESNTVRRVDGQVAVSVPEDQAEPEAAPAAAGARESVKVQALLAHIGTRMGLQIWVPAPDRAAVLKEAPSIEPRLLTELPLNYDNTTLKTIEYIDVLWLKGRSIARAFEVEHTPGAAADGKGTGCVFSFLSSVPRGFDGAVRCSCEGGDQVPRRSAEAREGAGQGRPREQAPGLHYPHVRRELTRLL